MATTPICSATRSRTYPSSRGRESSAASSTAPPSGTASAPETPTAAVYSPSIRKPGVVRPCTASREAMTVKPAPMAAVRRSWRRAPSMPSVAASAAHMSAVAETA